MNADMDVVVSMFELETGRLQLRLLDSGDEVLFCSLYTDPETMRFIGPVLSSAQAASCFREVVAGMGEQPVKCLYFAIVEKMSRQVLGVCGIPNFDAHAVTLELGIVLRLSARSKGVAKEGVAALISRLFKVLSVDELWVQFSRYNPAVERAALGLGFSRCGVGSGDEGSLGIVRWSVHRSSWCEVEVINHPRGSDVERDRFS